jgi:hypothetical protein
MLQNKTSFVGDHDLFYGHAGSSKFKRGSSHRLQALRHNMIAIESLGMGDDFQEKSTACRRILEKAVAD